VTSGVDGRVVALRVRGCGRFTAYCSREPTMCVSTTPSRSRPKLGERRCNTLNLVA
jgi:hypothetical protein